MVGASDLLGGERAREFYGINKRLAHRSLSSRVSPYSRKAEMKREGQETAIKDESSRLMRKETYSEWVLSFPYSH